MIIRIEDQEHACELVEAQTIEYNENKTICAACGGRCCKNSGCEIFPQDVKKWFNTKEITSDIIVKLLNSGYIQIDWFYGDVRFSEYGYKFTPEYFENHEELNRIYYLHMRSGNDPAIHGSWGGTCRMLTEHGCPMSWDMRPTGGKSLIPNANGDGKCHESFLDKKEAVLAWIPYQEILDAAMDEFGQEFATSFAFSLGQGIDQTPVKFSTKEITSDEDVRRALNIID